MTRGDYWGRRLRRHALVGTLSLALAAGLALALPSPSRNWRLSMGTAYAALVLLALTLSIGPWQVLRRRANPVTTDLRRDIGIWAGVLGLLHAVVGLFVHMKRRWWYFVYPPDQPHRVPLRHDLFGTANWLGVAATLVLVLLLALSNDLSLRRLGTRRWKALQRWNYALGAGVALHAAAYQLVEKRMPPFPLVLAVVVVATVAVQLAGRHRVLRGGE